MPAYFEITIIVGDIQTREILIAELADAGYDGFQEEKGVLKAYVEAERFSQDKADALLLPFSLPYTTGKIEEQNWNAIWESSFDPVVVHDFCAVRASFHAGITAVKHEVIVTPKMSFGTGHHATTFMMIDAMSAIDFKGKTVFDFGTGTGVLAILAEKCGAGSIVAIDNDAWSIDNAAENISINTCKKIDLRRMDAMPVDGKFDIILANINRHVILQNLYGIKQHLADGGVVLLSGLLSEDETVIERELNVHNLVINKKLERNSWICLQLVNE